VKKKGGQQWGIFCFRKLNNFKLGQLIEMLIVPCKGTPICITTKGVPIRQMISLDFE
jgi:hypothetical protein